MTINQADGIPLAPNSDDILDYLTTLYRDVEEFYPGGLIEIRCLRPKAEDPKKTDSVSAYYGCDDDGLIAATQYVQQRNIDAWNCYSGINPRKPTTVRKWASSDKDIDLAFSVVVDMDVAPNAIETVMQPSSKPAMVVVTGTVPMCEGPRLLASI